MITFDVEKLSTKDPLIRFKFHKLLDSISPSYQSVFQLSLEVLVCYRSFVLYLVLEVIIPSHIHIKVTIYATQF